MKRFILLAATVLAALGVAAENNPSHTDLVWVTVPDHADWLYCTGERAKVEVQLLRYGMPQDAVVKYELAGDMMPADTRGEVTLHGGRATIDMGTMREPGFRDCRMEAVIDGVKFKHHIKVGFSPEKLTPYTPDPADFDAFWDANLQELKRLPATWELTPMPEYSTTEVECHLAKIPVTQRNVVYAHLFVPRGAKAGSCPVVLNPPGAGVKPIRNPIRRRYYADEGCIRLELEIHGIDPRLGEDVFAEIRAAFHTKENTYLTTGLDDRDRYYMKRVYLACVRCIDLLTAMPEWDGKNVIVQGGSQGGALALITTALDKRVTACVANHPALSDMAGYMAGRAGGYPHFFRQKGMDTPEKLNTMAYYDVVNFARRVNVPVRMTWGFNDDVCPPTTSYIVYNLLSCSKEALITPVNEHWTSEQTERTHLEWILSNLK